MDKITGFINMGNTCFMNCSLQMLIRCPKLVSILLDNEFKNSDLLKYKQTFQDYLRDTTKTLGPMILYKRYQSLNKNYMGLSQEDVHEYLTFIIDDMNELSKKINLNIKDLFKVELENKVTCLECGHYSSNVITENIMSLNVSDASNLTQCFLKFIQPEILGDNDLWYCDKCSKKVKSQKNIKITKLPEYLFIGLNRITIDSNCIYKNNKAIEFPMAWHIKKNYVLKGIIFHMGNIHGGHYMCAIYKNDQWFIIDDTNIMTVTWDNLKSLCSHAYMLMYHAI